MTALQNSRVVRAPQGRGGTKRTTTGSRYQVRLSAGKKRSFSQQQSRKLHGEMWASLLHKQGPLIFREEEIAFGCVVLVACPSCPDHSPEPPGPGRIIRNMLGWSQLEKTVRSGVWLFRGALQGESLFSALVAAGDWVRKGSYHTAWSVPYGSSCYLFVCVRARPRYRAMYWTAVLATACPCVEGYRSPNEALVCGGRGAEPPRTLNLYRGWKSCVVVGIAMTNRLFGECGDAKLIVSVSLGRLRNLPMEASVLSG